MNSPDSRLVVRPQCLLVPFQRSQVHLLSLLQLVLLIVEKAEIVDCGQSRRMLRPLCLLLPFQS
jgi:hypothetical protein